jgi:molybdopterin molybdotransferase
MAAPLLPVADARRMIVSSLSSVGSETIKLSEARGWVLAKDATARVSHPPADVSAMDGYALHAQDIAKLPASLKVVGESAAGHPWKGTLGNGEAVRIFTGAFVPESADTVVIQENTEAGDGLVTVKESTALGANIRPAGQDFRTGDTVLQAPRLLTARDIGLLSAMNLPEVPVYRKPRIGVLSTGDEIVLPGEAPSEGQIVSANGPGLCAFIEASGGEPVHLGVVPDDIEMLKTAVKKAEHLDMLVTSGGVSVGDHDVVKQALSEDGLKVSFHKIAMRPGKPLLFGEFMGSPLLGLPGNPVSAMVCAVLFLGPAINRLRGLDGNAPETMPALLDSPLKGNDGREDYIRAVVGRKKDGFLHASPLPKQDSAMIAALAKSNALVVRPPHAPPASTGDQVEVILLS